MVIRGASRGNGAQLANYLTQQADNDNVCVFDIRGTSQPTDLRKSLIEMSLTSELTMSDKGLYHAQINPAYGEDKMMQPKDWLDAAAILEKELNLSNQKRIIVFHEKKNRTHAHVVWERYNHEKGIMVSDSFSRLAQDKARKKMEQELVQKETPHRNVKRPEMKVVLSEIWKKTASGKEFIKASLQKGYQIAKGEFRHPFMVVDKEGRSFDLVRQLEGVKTKELRECLKEEKLRSAKEAIESVRQKQLKEKSKLPEERAQKPGVWVRMYEQKQAEDIESKHAVIKKRMIKELKDQLELQRQKQRSHPYEI
jgi:hypothetical protein